MFTPKGELIDLPAGATPIDFAYQIHTEVGHRCRGAKVNGKLVGLDYQLKTGEQVEILTAKRAAVPAGTGSILNLGYIKTARAKNKIRQWFRQQDRELNITAGREMLQNELEPLGVETDPPGSRRRSSAAPKWTIFWKTWAAVRSPTVDVAEQGAGAQQGRGAAQGGSAKLEPQEASAECRRSPIDGVAVQGIGNMLSYLARCCNAMPPDEILGFVTRGRGVAIHRRDCPNVLPPRPGSDHPGLLGRPIEAHLPGQDPHPGL